MFKQNGESFGTLTKWVKNKGIVFSTSLIVMTGLASSASAYGNYDSCSMDSCCEMPDFQVYADFLYWQSHVEGEAYALTGLPDATIGAAEGKIYSGGCDFTPGFRIGGVVDMGCCNWDFFAQYTWLNPSYSEEAAPTDRTLVGIFNPNVAINSASLHHNDHFNVLDFGMGRTFNVNDCFVFRPHFGFKATWQELDRRIDYNTVISPTLTSVQRFRDEIEFNGIGLRGGFDAAWKFSPCFSLVGGLAASAIYSDLDVKHVRSTFDITNGVAGDETIGLNTKGCHCVLLPVFELSLGVRWDSRVCDCYDVFVFVGWENQVWMNLNQYANDAVGAPLTVAIDETTVSLLNPGSFPVNGNVTYQGLTVRLGVGF